VDKISGEERPIDQLTAADQAVSEYEQKLKVRLSSDGVVAGDLLTVMNEVLAVEPKTEYEKTRTLSLINRVLGANQRFVEHKGK
jgi:hypothetical protein